MNLDKKQSSTSNQTGEEAKASERAPLTKSIMRAVKEHMSGFYNTDLSHYTYERKASHYPESRFDLTIFDPQGIAVLSGREARDGRMAIWTVEPLNRIESYR